MKHLTGEKRKYCSLLYAFVLLCLMQACSAPRVTMGSKLGKQIHKDITADKLWSKHYYGLYVADAETGEILYNHNGHDHFNPASTTKLFTYYLADKTLPDRMPFIDYIINHDTAIIWPYGDPEFLNPHFHAHLSLVDSLEALAPVLILSNAQYKDEKFGKGWAWDDFLYSFQAEKSFFPAYGNLISFTLRNKEYHDIEVYPTYFRNWLTYKPELEAEDFTVIRADFANAFDYDIGPLASANDKIVLPMSADKYSLGRLLNDTLDNHLFIESIPAVDYAHKQTMYGIYTDSLYRFMLQQSDNHIAEQLVLAVSYSLSDTLKSSVAINYALDSLFTFLPDTFIYADGSGLSRYNLNTPANNVALLKRMYEEDFNRTKKHLPKGGESGTLRSMFTQAPIEIYAKSGSMRNVYNLSGYIICRSGKVVLFSWMNNNFIIDRHLLKQGMEAVLIDIYNTY